MCRHIEHLSSVDILVKGVVEGVLLLTGTILPQLVRCIFFCEILWVLQYNYFLVKDLNQIKLSFEDLFLQKWSQAESNQDVRFAVFDFLYGAVVLLAVPGVACGRDHAMQ